MKYIKVFNKHSDYESFINGDTFVKSNVSICIENEHVHYNPITYADRYLTFTALEDGTFKFSGITSANTLSYSLDNGTTWVSLAHDTETPQVVSGSKILWKGENLTITEIEYNYGIGKFVSSGQFNAEGNIMSLLYGDDFAGQTDLTGKNYAFYGLFASTYLVSAENVSLPATTLAERCYQSMFQYCESLTTAPSAIGTSATTMAVSACTYMFYNCTSLTTAPELPATTLGAWCYSNMFTSCSNLTTTPELPATTLADYCYYNMFAFCTSLTTAPELPATSLASSCYKEMFYRCTSLTTAPELPATTLAIGCYGSMFERCTNLTTAPELPATTLANSCYQEMFSGCTSLTTAPELPATALVAWCYEYMFNGCTSLNYIKAMFTTTPSTTYTRNWVSGVASTGTFVKNSAAAWTTTGTNGIPSGWTVETASA